MLNKIKEWIFSSTCHPNNCPDSTPQMEISESICFNNWIQASVCALQGGEREEGERGSGQLSWVGWLVSGISVLRFFVQHHTLQWVRDDLGSRDHRGQGSEVRWHRSLSHVWDRVMNEIGGCGSRQWGCVCVISRGSSTCKSQHSWVITKAQQSPLSLWWAGTTLQSLAHKQSTNWVKWQRLLWPHVSPERKMTKAIRTEAHRRALPPSSGVWRQDRKLSSTFFSEHYGTFLGSLLFDMYLASLLHKDSWRLLKPWLRKHATVTRLCLPGGQTGMFWMLFFGNCKHKARHYWYLFTIEPIVLMIACCTVP